MTAQAWGGEGRGGEGTDSVMRVRTGRPRAAVLFCRRQMAGQSQRSRIGDAPVLLSREGWTVGPCSLVLWPEPLSIVVNNPSRCAARLLI